MSVEEEKQRFSDNLRAHILAEIAVQQAAFSADIQEQLAEMRGLIATLQAENQRLSADIVRCADIEGRVQINSSDIIIIRD